MIETSLVRAIVDLAMFLEQSSDDTVDPDAAIKEMENLAYNLSLLSPPAREQFVAELQAIAPSYGQDAEFVEEFASNFGLED